MTSPPMLLGRKLLKNVATRNDPVSALNGEAQILRAEQQAPAPGAGQHHDEVEPERAEQPAADAVRATAHSRATSTREKRTHSSTRLTTALRTGTRRRARAGLGKLAGSIVTLLRKQKPALYHAAAAVYTSPSLHA